MDNQIIDLIILMGHEHFFKCDKNQCILTNKLKLIVDKALAYVFFQYFSIYEKECFG